MSHCLPALTPPEGGEAASPAGRTHVTYGTLMREIPHLEPDDAFVDRLAELAAASTPSRGGVVVPVAFGGPAARTVVVAAAVAAITAGAAAAATHLSHGGEDS